MKHGFTDADIDSRVSIDGYSVYRLDRQNDKIRGGVLCYIKDNIPCKQNINLSETDIEELEATFLDRSAFFKDREHE